MPQGLLRGLVDGGGAGCSQQRNTGCFHSRFMCSVIWVLLGSLMLAGITDQACSLNSPNAGRDTENKNTLWPRFNALWPSWCFSTPFDCGLSFFDSPNSVSLMLAESSLHAAAVLRRALGGRFVVWAARGLLRHQLTGVNHQVSPVPCLNVARAGIQACRHARTAVPSRYPLGPWGAAQNSRCKSPRG